MAATVSQSTRPRGAVILVDELEGQSTHYLPAPLLWAVAGVGGTPALRESLVISVIGFARSIADRLFPFLVFGLPISSTPELT